MRSFFLFSFLITTGLSINAQKVYTKNGSISFYSKASIENIAADNSQVMSTLDLASGQLQFSILIKAFHFKKSLMEEHFNENYMESDKFPKATFKGNIKDLKIDLTKDGSYPVSVTGDMMIHGVTKNITSPGTIIVKGGVATGNATFKIKLADYKVSIPAVVKDNISETVDITVSCVYDKKM
ncbi:MAG: YceI family protein [Ferruginibacter sp.]